MTTLLIWMSLVAAQPSDSRVETLAWMAGCWRLQTASRVVDEQWMAPSGGSMLGMSRTVARGRTVEHEFVHIREEAGQLVYIAQPASQAVARFAATMVGTREVTFENREHDFPQRIIYRATPEGGMHARIEGEREGRQRGVDFAYASVACGAP